MKKLLIISAATLVLAGCGGAAAAKPAAKPPASPSTMSLLQSCRALRADMLANGGQADKPTLRRIVAQTASPELASHAQQAEADVGNGTLWWIDAAEMAHDCQGTGVNIPTEGQ